MTELWALVAWAMIWGIVGALIAPRKGYTPGGGFAIGAVFAIFGIAYLALQPDDGASYR